MSKYPPVKNIYVDLSLSKFLSPCRHRIRCCRTWLSALRWSQTRRSAGRHRSPKQSIIEFDISKYTFCVHTFMHMHL